MATRKRLPESSPTSTGIIPRIIAEGKRILGYPSIGGIVSLEPTPPPKGDQIMRALFGGKPE
jgi:hypothetical protein